MTAFPPTPWFLNARALQKRRLSSVFQSKKLQSRGGRSRLAELPALGATGTLQGNTNSFSDLAGLNLPDLRRLGTARTLTLVNGKRHVGGSPGTTAVDLGTIFQQQPRRVDATVFARYE